MVGSKQDKAGVWLRKSRQPIGFDIEAALLESRVSENSSQARILIVRNSRSTALLEGPPAIWRIHTNMLANQVAGKSS